MLYPEEFDVIVVGGGHAGTEAALASARMGCKTLLLTHNIETLGQMSCNPSIGGIGKGHLVKEVDALGGAMAIATDEGGIQFRILNSSKGPAVRATRAQADRILYKAAIRRRLENQPNLTLFQQAVDDLMVEGDRVVGAVTQVGIRFRARTVVLTAGTFLDGRIHVGLNNYQAGRAGDPPAVSLSARLKELKLPQGRLKTGTPPRLDGRTIDFSKCDEQPGDGMPGGDRADAGVQLHGQRGDASAADAVLDHPHQRAHPRDHPLGFRSQPDVHRQDRRRRSALLPERGRQDQPLCRQGKPPDLPGAGRADHQRVSTRTASRPACRSTSSTSWCARWRAWRTRTSCGPGYAIEYDYFDPRALKSSFETRAIAGPVLRRPDQRHHGLRRGGGARAVRRHQRGAAMPGRGSLAAAPRRSLPGRAGRRPDHQGRDRAVPHVHQPGRVPAAAARGQRRHAPDRGRARRLGLVDDARWDAFYRKRDAVSRETERLQGRSGSIRATCRRPNRSGCWARRSSTNTTSATCCAGPT